MSLRLQPLIFCTSVKFSNWCAVLAGRTLPLKRMYSTTTVVFREKQHGNEELVKGLGLNEISETGNVLKEGAADMSDESLAYTAFLYWKKLPAAHTRKNTTCEAGQVAKIIKTLRTSIALTALSKFLNQEISSCHWDSSGCKNCFKINSIGMPLDRHPCKHT